MSKGGNVVLSGDYAGASLIADKSGKLVLMANEGPLYLDSTTVENYNVVNNSESRSAGSAVKRAAVGKAVFGRKAMIAGAATAKKVVTYEVGVNFKDGKRSLLQLDEAGYKLLSRNSF